MSYGLETSLTGGYHEAHMTRLLPRAFVLSLSLAVVGVPCSAQDRDSLLSSILMTEDSRARGLDALDPLMVALNSPDPAIVQRAVRALGRLEHAPLVRSIEPFLSAESADVRQEAANALGQAVSHGDPSSVRTALITALATEPNPAVRGTIAQTLGRLRYPDTAHVREVELTLLRATRVATGASAADASVPTLLGVVKGLEALTRIHRGHPLADATVERLETLARYGREPLGAAEAGSDGPAIVRLRRLSTGTLATAGRLRGGVRTQVLGDFDVEVRRLAVRALATDSAPDRERVLGRSLSDPSPQVRYETLRILGAQSTGSDSCDPVLPMTADSSPHVRLLAIDVLAAGCRTTARVVDSLVAWINLLEPAARVWETSWHGPSHALVALARVAPHRAASHVARFAAHRNRLVRVYAARAAGQVPVTDMLERLAFDEDDNVRTEAITHLSGLRGHEVDSIYIAALARPDYQLLIAAARALDGSPSPRAVPALLRTLARVTSERRMTSRDTRVALLDRIAALEGAGATGPLLTYLEDFDPVIANTVAEYLAAWTGQPYRAAPRRLPHAPPPSLAELAQLAESRAVMHMRGGGTIVMRLFPEEAPTNAARFARLARAGYFDGLTFHRVVPNFVVQGGSPGANEYMGDGPYTRDELGLRSHARGTVGLSTRGRDTGDAQLFINLVDNVRLDHNYTIFAEVVSGMEVVDAMLEGATMERMIVLPRGFAPKS